MKGYWWAEHTGGDAFGGSNWPWQAALETEEGMILTLKHISFETKERCEEWIEQYVLGRELRRD